MVDAVRIGYITARNQKALRKWQSHRKDAKPRGLSGDNLENVILGLAAAHPEYVVFGAP